MQIKIISEKTNKLIRDYQFTGGIHRPKFKEGEYILYDGIWYVIEAIGYDLEAGAENEDPDGYIVYLYVTSTVRVFQEWEKDKIKDKIPGSPRVSNIKKDNAA